MPRHHLEVRLLRVTTTVGTGWGSLIFIKRAARNTSGHYSDPYMKLYWDGRVISLIILWNATTDQVWRSHAVAEFRVHGSTPNAKPLKP